MNLFSRPRTEIESHRVFVDIREVGPRDGLQAENPLSVDTRIDLIHRLIAAGVQHIEVASFMRDDMVPSMAGAEEVVAAVPPRDRLIRTGLVANQKGAERAIACGLDELTITVSLSETYSKKNTGKSRTDSLRAIADIILCVNGTIPTDIVISCAFGSPYGDVVSERELAPFVRQLRGVGSERVTLADTTGLATPRSIRAALEQVGTNVGLHLHETRGMGVVNAFAGLEAGVRRFDCSIGGIGGSPFADGAAGNVATESLVFLFDDLGYETLIDLEQLLGVTPYLAGLIGRSLPSALAQLHSNWTADR